MRLFSSWVMMLKATAKDPPDLVLAGRPHAEMDGYEVCRRMRGEAALHDVPCTPERALGRQEQGEGL